MDFIDGMFEEEDSKIVFPRHLSNTVNLIGNDFTKTKSPFGDPVETGEFVTTGIHFDKLIKELKGFLQKKANYNFDYTSYAQKIPNQKRPSVNDPMSTKVESRDLSVPFSIRDHSLLINGMLNTKLALVDFGRKHEFEFIFNPNIEQIFFRIKFTYKIITSSSEDHRYAIILESKYYKDFKQLLNYLGIIISEAERQYIIKRFDVAFKNAGKNPNKLDFLYEFAPDFVVSQKDDTALLLDLFYLAHDFIDAVGSNENVAIINLLNGIKDKKKFYDLVNANPDFIRKMLGWFSDEYLSDLIVALCHIGFSVWDENDFKNILTFAGITEFKDPFDGQVYMKIVGWCMFHEDIVKYEIGYTVHSFDKAPIADKSKKVTLGWRKPFLPVSMISEGKDVYVPAFVAEYFTNIELDKSRKDFVDLMLLTMLPQSAGFKAKSLLALNKVPKRNPIKSTEELVLFLDSMEEGYLAVDLDHMGIKVLLRGTTRNHSGSLFSGSQNTIMNGLPTSTDPIKSTIFAIESETKFGAKGILQMVLTKDMKEITLVSPSRRVAIELEVAVKISAENFSKISSKEISTQQARKIIKEIYGKDLPSKLSRDEATELLISLPSSSLEQSMLFYQKAIKL